MFLYGLWCDDGYSYNTLSCFLKALFFKERAIKNRYSLFPEKYDFNTPNYPLIKLMGNDKKKFFNTST